MIYNNNVSNSNNNISENNKNSAIVIKQLYNTISFSLPHPPPPSPSSLSPPAPVGGDGGHRGQGAGRADQGPPASRRRAVHGASHGPAGGAAGLPAQEPHTGGQGQRRPQSHQGNAGSVGVDESLSHWPPVGTRGWGRRYERMV